MRIDEIPFEIKETKGRPPVRDWDVRITLNKCGKEDRSFVIRFGFLNEATKIFKEYAFIEISKIINNRIYFKLYNSRENRNTHKLSRNSKAIQPNLYMAITPSAEEDKKYRANWINGTYQLKYDDECGLYYIESHTNE